MLTVRRSRSGSPSARAEASSRLHHASRATSPLRRRQQLFLTSENATRLLRRQCRVARADGSNDPLDAEVHIPAEMKGKPHIG
jgi:hypothetical protein